MNYVEKRMTRKKHKIALIEFAANEVEKRDPLLAQTLWEMIAELKKDGSSSARTAHLRLAGARMGEPTPDADQDFEYVLTHLFGAGAQSCRMDIERAVSTYFSPQGLKAYPLDFPLDPQPKTIVRLLKLVRDQKNEIQDLKRTLEEKNNEVESIRKRFKNK
jgi:hypothetical protein